MCMGDLGFPACPRKENLHSSREPAMSRRDTSVEEVDVAPVTFAGWTCTIIKVMDAAARLPYAWDKGVCVWGSLCFLSTCPACRTLQP